MMQSLTQNNQGIKLVTTNSHIIDIKYNQKSNSTTLYSIIIGNDMTNNNVSATEAEAIYLVDQRNSNLTPSQRELIKWHFCLGHVGFKVWCAWCSLSSTTSQLCHQCSNMPCMAIFKGKEKFFMCPSHDKINSSSKIRKFVDLTTHFLVTSCILAKRSAWTTSW
jgi:hypothetical protein